MCLNSKFFNLFPFCNAKGIEAIVSDTESTVSGTDKTVTYPLINRFSAKQDIHHHKTRNKFDFHIKRGSKNVKKLSTNCQDARFWNELPLSIKQSVSLSSFKSKLKKIIVEYLKSVEMTIILSLSIF